MGFHVQMYLKSHVSENFRYKRELMLDITYGISCTNVLEIPCVIDFRYKHEFVIDDLLLPRMCVTGILFCVTSHVIRAICLIHTSDMTHATHTHIPRTISLRKHSRVNTIFMCVT